MKKAHKILLCSVIFLLMIAETESGITKAETSSVRTRLASVVSMTKHGEANPSEYDKLLIIKRGNDKVTPRINMEFENGDEVMSLKDAVVTLDTGGAVQVLNGKTSQTINNHKPYLNWGEVLCVIKKSYDIARKFLMDSDEATMGPERTKFKAVVKSYKDEKTGELKKKTDLIVLEGEVKLDFKTGNQSSQIISAYSGYINGTVFKKGGITTSSDIDTGTFGKSGLMLGKGTRVPQMTTSSYSDPVAEKIAEVEKWFGDVVLASNYDFGESGIKYAKKAKGSDIGMIASAQDYGKDPGSDEITKQRRKHRNVSIRPINKLSIASIVIGENHEAAPAELQSVIIRSEGKPPQSAVKGMELKEGNQIVVTRNASVILETGYGQIFLREMTCLQVKQGKPYIAWGNAYFDLFGQPNSIDTKYADISNGKKFYVALESEKAIPNIVVLNGQVNLNFKNKGQNPEILNRDEGYIGGRKVISSVGTRAYNNDPVNSKITDANQWVSRIKKASAYFER